MLDIKVEQGTRLDLEQMNKSITSWRAKNVNELRSPLTFDGVKIWRRTENIAGNIQRRYTVTESGEWVYEVIWTDFGKVAEVIKQDIFSMRWHSVKEFVRERNYTECA